MDVVKASSLNFSYDKCIFDDVNFTVEKGEFITFIGSSGCGKSTLFNILAGDLSYDGEVYVFGKSINYSLNKGYIGLVSIQNEYRGLVIDILVDTLKKKGKPYDKIRPEIQRVIKKTGIEHLINCDYSLLSYSDMILVNFSIQLLNKPRLLIIDNAFSYLDFNKDKIVREIIRLNKKATVINITNDVSECIYGNGVIIMNSSFKRFNVCDMNEEDFRCNGLDIPFMISLSSKLKFYGVIDDNYLDMERLIDDLWE